jgi:hypothetical protein
VVEHPIPEAVACVDECSPRFRTDHTVDGEAPCFLKSCHRQPGSVLEYAHSIGINGVPERGKPVLDIQNRLSSIALVIEPHVLNACRYWP